MHNAHFDYSTNEVSSSQTEQGYFELDGESLSTEQVVKYVASNMKCRIAPNCREHLIANRQYLEEIVQKQPIYGVTTGYGEMVYIQVEEKHESQLQTNLIRSHCAGAGPYFSKLEAKAIMLARINAFAKGYSGIREELLDQLIQYYNNDIIPVIPEIGSLGASGDLGPLSHIAITLIGEGYVFDEDEEVVRTDQMLKKHALRPLTLKFKEGLALINGTSAMTGLGSLVVTKAYEQVLQAEAIASLVLEAQEASLSPFMPLGHDKARPHAGQIESAQNIRRLLKGSQLIKKHEHLCDELANSDNKEVFLQKAYTLRCIPQVNGAIRDSLQYARSALTTELNSANDNPLFEKDEEIFHGGNFHGQPIAFAMDFSAIALVQLGVISERRTNRLLNRYLSNGLPDFLVKGTPGLSCGFAGAQYPATALIAENRTICTPASIQSVPSNGDNQDVVSMGLIAARNARRILKNNYVILAVEALAAAQAIDIRECYAQLSPLGKKTYDTIRQLVPTLEEDRYMTDDIYCVANLLENNSILTEDSFLSESA